MNESILSRWFIFSLACVSLLYGSGCEKTQLLSRRSLTPSPVMPVVITA